MNREQESSIDLVSRIARNAANFMDGSSRTERTLNAFRKIDRTSFLGESYSHIAPLDESIGVGCNQTTSQPGMLAFMFDKLHIGDGERILEVGTGVGYAAAVASMLCGTAGEIYTIECIPELAERARTNLKEFNNIHVIQGDGSLGLREHAPFDVIFFSAGIGPEFEFEPLLNQLSAGGRLMVPRRFGELFLFSKTAAGVREEQFYSVSFVPLKGCNSGW